MEPAEETEKAYEGPILAHAVLDGIEVIEKYPLKPPFLQVVIAKDVERKTSLYILDEIPLSAQEMKVYREILETLQYELKAPRGGVDPHAYFVENAGKVVDKYKVSMGGMPSVAWAKILYYAERDMVGLGPIEPFIDDPNIEDISVDGVGRPVYVWHRKYESLKTNLSFESDKELDETVSRLVHLSGKHVSTAYPIVDATLPGRHRLVATFKREVTPSGGTLTIRKFRSDPVTVVDMLNFGTLDHKIAAYLWLVMEHRASAIIVGATASGKTTLMNSMLSMVRPGSKILTIEDVKEINIAHENWVSMVSRPSYGLSSERIGEVSLFDLVRASMRMRPDMLVVGEVRGEEAYVLFQAISTGHGGMCTLHADDAPSAIQRVTSKPMDVAMSYIAFLDLIVSVRRVALPGKKGAFGRRIISVDELTNRGQSLVTVFRWDPASDVHRGIGSDDPEASEFVKTVGFDISKSVKIQQLAKDRGFSMPEMAGELLQKVKVLRWLQTNNIRGYKDVGSVMEQYHHDPREFVEKLDERPVEMVKVR